MSWISSLPVSTPVSALLATPAVATAVTMLRPPRGRNNSSRNLAFIAVVMVAGAKVGLPAVGLAPGQLVPDIVLQLLTPAAIVATIAWLGGAAVQLCRARRGRLITRTPAQNRQHTRGPCGCCQDEEVPIR